MVLTRSSSLWTTPSLACRLWPRFCSFLQPGLQPLELGLLSLYLSRLKVVQLLVASYLNAWAQIEGTLFLCEAKPSLGSFGPLLPSNLSSWSWPNNPWQRLAQIASWHQQADYLRYEPWVSLCPCWAEKPFNHMWGCQSLDPTSYSS